MLTSDANIDPPIQLLNFRSTVDTFCTIFILTLYRKRILQEVKEWMGLLEVF